MTMQPPQPQPPPPEQQQPPDPATMASAIHRNHQKALETLARAHTRHVEKSQDLTTALATAQKAAEVETKAVLLSREAALADARGQHL